MWWAGGRVRWEGRTRWEGRADKINSSGSLLLWGGASYRETHLPQAKSNFLDVTAEMLDSSVHRTIMENQHLTDELAVQSAEIEKLVHQNQATACGVYPRLGWGQVYSSRC